VPGRLAATPSGRVVAVRLDQGGSVDGGRTRADALVDGGADLLVLQGVAGSAEGLLVAATLLDLEPVRAVGTAPGDDWVRQTVAVRDGLRTARTHRADPAGLLEAIGAGAVAEGAGLLPRRPIGAPRCSSTAPRSSRLRRSAPARLAPGASAWWLAGSAPPVPAAVEAHRELNLPTLLELGLPGPEGADLARSVLEQACDLVAGA
jgi:nicotinate-nucleotide--dimethylbenzimidazole phosphoribosyltransferase